MSKDSRRLKILGGALGDCVHIGGVTQFLRLAEELGYRTEFTGPATSVEAFRDEGYLPDALLNYLALLGWSLDGETTIVSAEMLQAQFSLERVSKNPAIFDFEKLAWMNGHYIRNLPPARFEQLATPYLERNFVEHSMDLEDHTYVSDVLSLVQERIRVLSEVGEAAAPFFGDLSAIEEKAVRKHYKFG